MNENISFRSAIRPTTCDSGGSHFYVSGAYALTCFQRTIIFWKRFCLRWDRSIKYSKKGEVVILLCFAELLFHINISLKIRFCKKSEISVVIMYTQLFFCICSTTLLQYYMNIIKFLIVTLNYFSNIS